MNIPSEAQYDFHTKHAIANQEELQKSTKAGCFYCRKIFDPKEIKEWIGDKEGPTAVCPFCGIDSVFGDASGREVSEKTVERMHNIWVGS